MQQSRTNVLWLTAPSVAKGYAKTRNDFIRAVGINPMQMNFRCFTEGCLKKRTKTIWEWDEDQREVFEARVKQANPSIIVVQDKAALGYLTSKYISLALCRGSIYYWNGIPCLVMDDLKTIHWKPTGSWMLQKDIEKLKRWMNGNIRKEPAIDLIVCDTREKIDEFVTTALNSIAIAEDIETAIRLISCNGFACLTKDMQVRTFVIPLIDTTREGNLFWQNEEDEIYAWEAMQKVNASNVPKVFQNGTYDSTYLAINRIPPKNYIFDTCYIWHSLFIEAPKRIDVIASICLDTYTYWKDEAKEDQKWDDKNAKIPGTKEGMKAYWLYNGLDCHNDMLIFLVQLQILTNPKMQWAADNYKTIIRQSLGPAFAMSMRNISCNSDMLGTQVHNLEVESQRELQPLLTMVDKPDFNPNSPTQVAGLLYDILKAKPVPRKGRSTDETVLKVLQTQNLILDKIITQIWATKKPANNASKYQLSKVVYKGRFRYKQSPTATDTTRYNSSSHNLWMGTNIQNLPYVMRVALEADYGYLLNAIDYSQSDAYFTAYSSQDLKFIATMESTKDTHCIHAAEFFKIDYDKLYEAHQREEAWTSHNKTGVRSITKRIVYGANYLMQGATLFLTMEKEAVVAAAVFLGFADAEGWPIEKLNKFCDWMLLQYFNMYDHLLDWIDEECAKADENGKKVIAPYGWTRIFFGKMKDHATKRKLAAYFGQAGTAGNINKAMDTLYYNGFEQYYNYMMLLQIHDEVVGQMPYGNLHCIPAIQQAMENPCTLHGRTFNVPTEAKVGFGMGKRLMKYHEQLTVQEIKDFDIAFLEDWCAKEGTTPQIKSRIIHKCHPEY